MVSFLFILVSLRKMYSTTTLLSVAYEGIVSYP